LDLAIKTCRHIGGWSWMVYTRDRPITSIDDKLCASEREALIAGMKFLAGECGKAMTKLNKEIIREKEKPLDET
jgi:hypothetical protein